MNTLKSRTVTSSLWTLGGYGTSQVLRLGSHLVLAWLLAPEIFGLMAMVKVVQQGLNMFSDIGIAPAIIQNRRGDDPEFLNTAWTMQIIRGFVMWAITCMLAWPFAALFARNDPASWQLWYLLPVAGFGAVISGFNSTALATLNKDLKLGRLTMIELTTQIVSLVVMVGWALIHPTVWAMVGGGLAGSLYKLMASHRLIPGKRVRLTWNSDCAIELIRFGRWIFLSTLFTFLAQNLDKLILGNVLTMADLGLYSIAFVFGRVALHVTGRLGGAVLFPVYAKYQNDTKRMMSIALRGREVVLWAGVATCLAIAIGSPIFFETLWDQRYHAAGGIAQWAVLYIWTSIVLMTMDRIPLALGNSRALFFSNVWRTLGIGLAVGGYMIADLPGFLVGLALGPVISHAYILAHIPSDRGAIAMQGVWFTLGGLAYAIPAILLTRWVGATSDAWSWAVSVVGLICVPGLLAVWIIWKRVRGDNRGNRDLPAAIPSNQPIM